MRRGACSAAVVQATKLTASWIVTMGMAVAAVACSSQPVESDATNDVEPIAEQSEAISGENLSGANLAGTNLAGTNLAGTNLAGANLGGNNLAGNNLAGTNLAGTNLAGNNLAGSNLAGSNLAGSNLAGNNLSGNNLAGTNLAGSNLAGVNLAGSNLAGSNLSGTNLAGNNLAGTNLSGTNLSGSNSGVNIHGLSIPTSANVMLWSGEDYWKADGTNRAQSVVMGLGSTAFAKLLGQQSANAKIYVALGKLPWGFANSSGGSKALDAWEAIVWGDKTYSSFVMAAPVGTAWSGVAGFIKAVFRWQAPPTQAMDISGIEKSSQFDSTVQTSITTYTGMMDTAAKFRAGTIPAKEFMAGELGFITATTNNQSVSVDFSAWVRDSNGNGLVLGNVSGSPAPQYTEAVYMAVDKGNGQVGVIVEDAAWANNGMGSVTKMTDHLDSAYSVYQSGLTPAPQPTRCGGAMYMHGKNGSLYSDPTGSGGKCDSGLMWAAGCVTGSQNWTGVSGTTAPYNTWLQRTQAGGAYEQGQSCDTTYPVLSETYIHLFTPSFAYPAGSFDDDFTGTGMVQFNFSGSGWSRGTDTGCYKGANHYNSTTNSYLTFQFTGTQLKFYGVKDNKHGIGAVSIDGGTESNVDFYASTRAGNSLLWTSPTLSNSNHTFKLRVTGSKNASSTGTAITVDRIDTNATSCAPTSCAQAGKNCGSISDGCGGTISCGSCGTGQTCGAGGVPNVCAAGGSCTPETDGAFCARVGKNCGSVTAADNCGTSRTVSNCGSCTSPQTCGGGGTANVCGGGSASSCATPYQQANCLSFTATPATQVSYNGHNYTCTNGNCMHCADYASCVPGATGCPWGTVWTDNGSCL